MVMDRELVNSPAFCQGLGVPPAPRVLSGTGTHIAVPTRLVSEAEIIVSVTEKRLSFAGMSVSDGNECFDEGNNRVRLEEGLVRGAESSVRGGNDLFRLSKNHFRNEQNHFRHGNNCRWRRSRHALDSSGFACEWR